MRNMKIPRKEEKPEQPVIVSRITRLPAWYELTKSNQSEELKVEEQCMRDLWMKALWDRGLEVLPDGGRRLWWLLVSVNQTYLYMSQYIIHNIHRLEFTCRETSKDLRYTRKRPLYADGRRYCMDSNNLVQRLQYTAEAWWKYFYNKDIVSEWLLRNSGWWIANPWQTFIDMFQFEPCHAVMS